MSNKDAKVEECRHYLENYYCYDNEFTNLIQINACGLTREGYHELHYKKCKDNPNCYFKQLQTAKEENEQLAQQNKQLQMHSCPSCGEKFIHATGLELYEQNKQLETKKLRMQTALDKIRDIELASLDVDWDEYKAECGTTDFSAIVTNCEIGLGETEE